MNATLEKSVPGREPAELSSGRDGKIDTILHRIDLFALALALLGICFLTVTLTVLAAIDLVKFISNHSSSPVHRCLIIVFIAAIIWVALRWKRTGLY